MFFRRNCLTTIAILLPMGAYAQDYAHCYIGDAPADAPISNTQNLQGFLPTVQIATLRHGCGHGTANDQTMLANLIAKGGCSAESDASEFAMATFLESPAETLAWLKEDAGNDALMEALCTVSAACIPGDVGYATECQAKITETLSQ